MTQSEADKLIPGDRVLMVEASEYSLVKNGTEGTFVALTSDGLVQADWDNGVTGAGHGYFPWRLRLVSKASAHAATLSKLYGL